MKYEFLDRLSYREICLTKIPEEKENFGKFLQRHFNNTITSLLADFCIENNIPRVLSGWDRLNIYFQKKGYAGVLTKTYSPEKNGFYIVMRGN